MNRWWADGSSALPVLDVVDDGDVVQGVGTAALGYHAIAKSALDPLKTRTLVDVADVVEALSGVDRGPVAKALAAATAPVMGDAAGEYGRLLADQIHDDAVAGVQHAIQSWVAQGIPMPLAVERAADVVGVPVRRIGKYVNAVKAPSVPPAVRVDAADRALMDFAAYIGEREGQEPEVSKAIRFKEAEHPRDDDGQFRAKVATGDGAADRAARIERKKARESRNRRAARVRDRAVAARQRSTADAGIKLSDLAAFLSSRRDAEVLAADERAIAGRLPAGRARAGRAPLAAVSQSVEAKPARRTQAVAKPPAAPKRATSADPFHVQHDVRDHVAMVPVAILNKLKRNGFSAGELERTLAEMREANRLEFFSRDQVENDPSIWARALIGGTPMGMVIVGGSVPIRDGGPDTPEGFQLPAQASFSADPLSDETVVTRSRVDDEDAATFGIRAVRFHWDGEPIMKAREVWVRDGARVSVDVERDQLGQFSDADERRARMERRARRRRRNSLAARNRAVLSQRADSRDKAAQPSLQELAAYLAARGSAQAPARELAGRVPAGRARAGRARAGNAVLAADRKAPVSAGVPVAGTREAMRAAYADAQAVLMPVGAFSQVFGFDPTLKPDAASDPSGRPPLQDGDHIMAQGSQAIEDLRNQVHGGISTTLDDYYFNGDKSTLEFDAQLISSAVDLEEMTNRSRKMTDSEREVLRGLNAYTLAERLNDQRYSDIPETLRSGRFVPAPSDDHPGELEVRHVEYYRNMVTIAGDPEAIDAMRNGVPVRVKHVFDEYSGLIGLWDYYRDPVETKDQGVFPTTVVVVEMIPY